MGRGSLGQQFFELHPLVLTQAWRRAGGGSLSQAFHSTPSLARFIHWLTAPSVTPRALAISLWFQPSCLSSQALRRRASRQSVAWLDNVFPMKSIIHSFRAFRRNQ
jgi:hypothetical protein